MNTQIVNEQTVMLYFDNEISEQTYQQVNQVVQWVKQQQHPAIREIVPSYRAVLIYFDNLETTASELIENLELNQWTPTNSDSKQSHKVIKIPVCYGGAYGPDIEEVAQHNQISVDEVINIHSDSQYLIYMLGFMPGFPYLGGLDDKLHTPRRSEPRLSIEAGSVGIANNQTGLYPLQSPGGWQIIGRTPLKVFDLNRDPMTIYEAGDYIQFYAIDEQEYQRIEQSMKSEKFNLDEWVTNRYDN